MVHISSRHPWITIGIWLLCLVISGILISTLLADALTNEITFANNPESKQANNLLEQRLRGPDKVNEIVIIRSETMTVDNDDFKSQVESLYENLIALGANIVQGATNYYQFGDESLVSKDRHTTIMPLIMAGTIDEASENIDKVDQYINQTNKENSLQFLITGDASIGNDFSKVAKKDAQSAEIFGIPLALIILVLVFGSILAAFIPLILGILSIIVALGAAAVIGQGFQLTFFVTNMIIMMGLAIGIDYSLFILSRYREERGRGQNKIDAIETAGATAGRTVLFSGMTVLLALLGMLIVPLTVFQSLAVGAILVVIAAVFASQTLLPAVISVMGDKVNSWRIPVISRATTIKAERERGGFWSWTTNIVMKQPVIALVVAVVLLVAASATLLDINTGAAGVSTLPDSSPSKEAFLILDEEFSAGLVTPAEIVIDGDIYSEVVQTSIEHLQASLALDPAFYSPFNLEVNSTGDLALLSVPVSGDSTSNEAINAIKKLRSQYIPDEFNGAPVNVLVTGATAMNVDYFDITNNYLPIVFAFVLGLSFLLLVIVFRSLVVPLKAIIMNLLSVGAAYGLIVLVFQKGVGASMLGFQQVDAIEAWIPLFLFCVLFGLSMDYHMFLLSRIREHFDQSNNNSQSVSFGLRSTGSIITGAALIMVAVFSAFAGGELVMFQQMGFGLAVAVFLDATVVRSVLVPAAMKLLGKINWYLPGFLKWLPHFNIEGVED